MTHTPTRRQVQSNLTVGARLTGDAQLGGRDRRKEDVRYSHHDRTHNEDTHTHTHTVSVRKCMLHSMLIINRASPELFDCLRIIDNLIKTHTAGWAASCTHTLAHIEQESNRLTYHRVTKIFGGVLGNVEQLAILRHHHEEAVEGLREGSEQSCAGEKKKKKKYI